MLEQAARPARVATASARRDIRRTADSDAEMEPPKSGVDTLVRDISATARFSEKRLREDYSMTPVQLTDLCDHCGGIPGCVAGQ